MARQAIRRKEALWYTGRLSPESSRVWVVLVLCLLPTAHDMGLHADLVTLLAAPHGKIEQVAAPLSKAGFLPTLIRRGSPWSVLHRPQWLAR